MTQTPPVGPYKHTQRGTLILAVLLGLSALFIGMGVAFVKPLLFPVPILLVCAWLFHSLTIEIGEHELCWRFGPGLIHKKVPLGDIVSAEPVRTHFLEGWGIHLSRHGWLYNVSGFDAVAITLRGGKRFCLGTDEPRALAASLDACISRNPQNSEAG